LAKKKKKCPVCGVEVNKENLDKHLQKVHGERGEEEKESKKPVGAEKKTKGTRKRKPKKKDRTSAVVAIISLVVIVALVGTVVYAYVNRDGGPDEDGGNGGGKAVAVMNTTLGTIKIELDLDNAPDTAGNFIDLANRGFYNGVIFHRVIQGFVIQGGGYTTDETLKNADNIPWEDTGLKIYN
jgi:hypothetical protein